MINKKQELKEENNMITYIKIDNSYNLYKYEGVL